MVGIHDNGELIPTLITDVVKKNLYRTEHTGEEKIPLYVNKDKMKIDQKEIVMINIPEYHLGSSAVYLTYDHNEVI